MKTQTQPLSDSEFGKQIRKEVLLLADRLGKTIVIDSIDHHHNSPTSLNFVLVAKSGDRIRFTFPFFQTIALANSLAALEDLILKNWNRGHLPPKLEETPAVAKAPAFFRTTAAT